MQRIMKVTLAAMLMMGLCACGNQPAATSNLTLIQPLNQVNWVNQISSGSAAAVKNDGLIFMR